MCVHAELPLNLSICVQALKIVSVVKYLLVSQCVHAKSLPLLSFCLMNQRTRSAPIVRGIVKLLV